MTKGEFSDIMYSEENLGIDYRSFLYFLRINSFISKNKFLWGEYIKSPEIYVSSEVGYYH